MLPCYALYKNGYPLLLDTTAWNLEGSILQDKFIPIQTGIELEMSKLGGWQKPITMDCPWVQMADNGALCVFSAVLFCRI